MRPLRSALLGAIGILSATVAFGWGSDTADAATCGPAPEGHSAVAITIDRSQGSPTTRCAIVPIGATGFEVLRAGGFSIRVDEGFLCGIDGAPATGCGKDQSATHFWSYWRAEPGGAWTYSRVGAGGARASQRCGVQGWRWSARADSAQPPRVAVPAVSCAAPTPPPTVPPTVAPTIAPTTTARPATPNPGGVTPSPGGVTGPAEPPAPGGAADAGPNTSVPIDAAVEGGEVTAAPEPSLEDPDGNGGDSSADDGTDVAGSGDDGTGDGSDDPSADSGAERASAVAEGDTSSGSMSGVFLTVLLVGALATGATVLNRRRLRGESELNA